jgi:ribosomal protein S18 acetylase RimI-like enzyme
MITIRKGIPSDADFIKTHAYRLLDFELSSWREPERELMTQTDIENNVNSLLENKKDKEIFVAVDENGKQVGFLHMTIQTDYYTRESHAHITDIVVIAEAAGKGIGKLLLQKAEQWAIERNSRWVTLNVLETNKHAISVYEKSGYQPEWIKYLKHLSQDTKKPKR